MRTSADNTRCGWVLYDDSCGLCRRGIRFWTFAMRRRGYDIAPLQAPWVVERLGLAEDEQVEDLRVLLSNGEQLQGADAYRHLMRNIWWAYPFFLVACVPGLRLVFDWCYRTVARNRFRISKACRLDERPKTGVEES